MAVRVRLAAFLKLLWNLYLPPFKGLEEPRIKSPGAKWPGWALKTSSGTISRRKIDGAPQTLGRAFLIANACANNYQILNNFSSAFPRVFSLLVEHACEIVRPSNGRNPISPNPVKPLVAARCANVSAQSSFKPGKGRVGMASIARGRV